MAQRLTDKQKKRIIADYINFGSYSAVARIHDISATTVKKLVNNDPQSVRKCDQKKEQNTADMLAYMESRKGKAQEVIDLYLGALIDPEKLEDATLSQIATAFGIIIDKFTKSTAAEGDSLQKLDNLMREFKNVTKSETD